MFSINWEYDTLSYEIRYDNDILTHTFLGSEDFNLFEENEGNDTWTFE